MSIVHAEHTVVADVGYGVRTCKLTDVFNIVAENLVDLVVTLCLDLTVAEKQYLTVDTVNVADGVTVSAAFLNGVVEDAIDFGVGTIVAKFTGAVSVGIGGDVILICGLFVGLLDSFCQNSLGGVSFCFCFG